MTSKATTVEQYLAELPADRQKPVAELRKIIKKNLPKGFQEEMTYGMIGYVIPHSLYPKGYHCDPKQALPFINIASQKNFVAVYHMGVYANKELLNWFVQEYPKHTTAKLDMGKACIRFKKMETIPFKLLGELATKITAQQWMDVMDKYAKK